MSLKKKTNYRLKRDHILWLIAEKWLWEVRISVLFHCMEVYSYLLLNNLGKNWFIWMKFSINCPTPLFNLFSKQGIFKNCREMFEVYKTYSGYVYYPAISKYFQLSTINKPKFISINLVRNVRILRDGNKYLRSAKVHL